MFKLQIYLFFTKITDVLLFILKVSGQIDYFCKMK